jgi:hypothetical protein
MTRSSTFRGGWDAYKQTLLGWTKSPAINVTVHVPRDNKRKGAIFLIGSTTPCHLKATTEDGHPFQQPQRRIFGILSLRGSLRQARLGIVWDCSPSRLKDSSPSPQVRESSDDLLFSHLQVQGGIKITYQKTQPFFFPFLTWKNSWLPFLKGCALCPSRSP